LNEPGKTTQARDINDTDVVAWLRERIRVGRLVPGQRLVEIDITRETGASRSKVRNAFQRLATEGLITIEEFRGASVRSINAEDIRQIYRARIALEGISAADFTRRASKKDRQKLLALQGQLDACVASRDAAAFGLLNGQWHAAILTGSENGVIQELLQRLSVPINRLLFESFYDETRLRNANADHQAITAAIVAGNAEEAETRMRVHVEDGFRTLLAIASNFAS
jgi:DNA-binding GntR family transcriptional regulator